MLAGNGGLFLTKTAKWNSLLTPAIGNKYWCPVNNVKGLSEPLMNIGIQNSWSTWVSGLKGGTLIS